MSGQCLAQGGQATGLGTGLGAQVFPAQWLGPAGEGQQQKEESILMAVGRFGWFGWFGLADVAKATPSVRSDDGPATIC